MEKSLIIATLCVEFTILNTAHSFPIDISSVGEGESNPLWLTNYFLTGFGFFLLSIIIVFGCICCRNGKGFKQNEVKVIQEFSNSSGNLAVSRFDGFVNPTLNSELTIFPPLGANSSEINRFEPLPDIKYQAQNLRPAAFSYTEQEISSQDWFLNSQTNFPRNQLKYVQEYGRGWFGRVVEGEAQNITPNEKVTKVMVKILHEDATPTDHLYFLHEVKFYRDLKHSNILRLLGQCLEMEPFLIILECYPNGDLKSFLSQNLASAQALVEQGVTLRMCSNITSGLQFMHENKFIHTDLAARNCLVGPDLTIKIGDYGNSIEIFKTDYYCAGSVALPVRWCAPETLKCTDITIETREVTPLANIWSLGVVFWEICEFCKLPYAELSDDEVIVRVLGEKSYILEKPKMFCLHKDELYHLMKLCWKPPLQRPSTSQIYIILNNLLSSSKINQNEFRKDSHRVSEDFEQRWQNLKPNSIPKKDNAVEIDREGPVDCSIISLKLKNAKVMDLNYVDSPLGIFLTNKASSQESPRVCLKNDKKKPGKELSEDDMENDIIENKKEDPELSKVEFHYSTENQVLNLDEKHKEKKNEVDSWLKGVEINNEEDESFVRKISEAIRDLDATLAMEKTSSSEENSGKSTRQNSPGKDLKEANEVTVDFKLGQDTSSFMNFTQKTFELSSLQNTEQPQSLNFTDAYNEKIKEFSEDYDSPSLIMPYIEVNKCKNDILDESLKENDSFLCSQSRNSSDTDDEIWRRRIEKGEISEKVKEKSKSIANLMILTHIDSDDSDMDFDKPLDKFLHRNSLIRRSGSFAKSSLSTNNFGSENDLTFAVLEDDFKESLKKLSNHHKEHGHFDSLGVILPSHPNRENIWENLFKANKSDDETGKNLKTDPEEASATVFSREKNNQNSQNEDNFLANAASEKLDIKEILEGKEDENFLQDKCEKSFAKTCTMEGFTENGLVEISKFDSKPFETEVAALQQNSSHLRKNDVDSDISELKTRAEGSPLISNAAESVYPSLIENNRAFESLAKEESVNKNVSLEFSQNNAEESSAPPLKTNSFSDLKDLSYEVGDLKSRSYKTAEKCLEETENFLANESGFMKEPIAKSLIPQITITEEPEENCNEDIDEIFVMEEPVLKPLKFILKDDEIPSILEVNPIKSDDFINLEATPLKVKVCTEATENFADEKNSTVIVGACEDFTMDYFKGLKTTSEDLNVKKNIEDFQNREENLIVWDKHLEKALTQQLSNTNFDDISFKNISLDSIESLEAKQYNFISDFNISECPLDVISNFIEAERLHTEKMEEQTQLNRLTGLSVMTTEEEYEHFKLRTPDDERSSDSGFRDKGSLSESVEDACEGKYNLEDIEAELEEAFVKGGFTNCETEKEKDSSRNFKNLNNFEYEESKFYEDENRNDEDFSDIDGEIEFWQNKDESDYYPQISEFNPNCSQGWYLHPPDENMLTCARNINEDIVNALRNELQENLPVQNRSLDEFSDFYEREIEDPNRDINFHYMSEFSFPLSPILEDQDSFNNVSKKNFKNSLLEGNCTNKVKKNMVKLIESVKAIDTNTFMQYLDYMVENEGRDFYEIKEIVENNDEQKETFKMTEILEPQIDEFEEYDKKKPLIITFPSDSECSVVNEEKKGEAYILDENLECKKSFKFPEYNTADDILVINVNTNEATLLEEDKAESDKVFDYTEDQKDDNLDTMTDDSENDRLIFTPELLSPDRERSFSDISRSSNGTRTGDALSEITLSSPDMVPDCFSVCNQETTLQSESKEIDKELLQKQTRKLPEDSVASGVTLQFSNNEKAEPCGFSGELETRTSFVEKLRNDTPDNLENAFDKSEVKDSELPENNRPSSPEGTLNSNDLYEMSTSFMGDDDDGGNDDSCFDDIDNNEIGNDCSKSVNEGELSSLEKVKPEQTLKEENCRRGMLEDVVVEEGNTVGWQSESSEDEVSSSSEEFIWKLYETVQSHPSSEKIAAVEAKSKKDIIKEEKTTDTEAHESDDNESSTGSSASLTEFVPSAWNSQATPSRSVLKSPENKTDRQKKNVWFKKQKYHCVYEYPREPSDSDDADGSPYKQSSCDKNVLEAPIKHFNYGVNTVELPNQHFPYGISKLIDLSACTDWDFVEGEDVELSLTDTDSDNGSGKSDVEERKTVDRSFYNLSPFDYDFNTADITDGNSEFFVSSSSRPFQGSPNNYSSGMNVESKTIKGEIDSKDFVTPDSGVEDCSNILSPLDKISLNQDNLCLKVKKFKCPNAGEMNILDNLNFNFAPENKKTIGEEVDFNSVEDITKPINNFSVSNSLVSLCNSELGQLKHTRNKLKLDLPHNHNAELGSVINVQKE